jgi:hypothetical protein
VTFDHIKPEPTPRGAEVLDRARAAVQRFCVLPFPEAVVAVVLWCAVTHALPALPAAPRLAITSPVKRTGKTRLLDVIEGISHDPLPTMNATVAAVFRSLDRDHPPTLIFDEVDTIFGSKRVAENNEDLRGLLNAGFQRGKSALRCVGPLQKPTLFATFAMAALAGIGALPDTITDRAINIRMRRRKPNETVSPFRERRDRPTLTEVRDQLHEWLTDAAILAELEKAEPTMDLEDRAADVWEPLVAVADVAGGEWPELARAAASKLTAEAAAYDDHETLGVQLLHDLQEAFRSIMIDWVRTEVLLQHLRGMKDAPWAEMELTGHRLGALLREFQIRSKRNTAGTQRGYLRASFVDAWERYPAPKLPTEEDRSDETSRASESVSAATDQGKPSDTCSDILIDDAKRQSKCQPVSAGHSMC